MSLKLTIFGLTLSSSWGNGHATPLRAIIRALHRRGHRVSFFEKDVDYYARRRDFDSCSYCRLVLYPDWNAVRHEALDCAADSDAVIVTSYCPEGARISAEILELSRPLRVYYDLDTPVTLNCLRGGDLDYLRRDHMSEFDLYLSFTGGRILGELENVWGVRSARPLYGCVDPDLYVRVPEKEEYRCALSYMGTYAADRQEKLEELLLEPSRRLPALQFLVAGPLYPWHWQWPPNVRRFEHVAPGDHPAFYSSSRATLNITRGEMASAGYCPSGRFFEASACGTAVLSDYWEGLESFFSYGDEIFLVNCADDVVRALKMPDAELSQLASRARQHTLDEHTGERRAEQLLGYLDEARRYRAPQPVREVAS
jgi:spore maturation protein CgeB